MQKLLPGLGAGVELTKRLEQTDRGNNRKDLPESLPKRTGKRQGQKRMVFVSLDGKMYDLEMPGFATHEQLCRWADQEGHVAEQLRRAS